MCGLESRPRWIELDNFGHRYYRKMCSNCGEVINKRELPIICPNCKERMLNDSERLFTDVRTNS